MGRRIRWLGLVIVVCFALVLLQLVNIQVRQGNALADNPNNPRNAPVPLFDQPRGRILAADGTPLAYSASTPKGPYKYQRVYPAQTASLFSGIVGYDSLFYGTSGIEDYYNGLLRAHKQGPQSFSQFLSGQTSVSTDDITLTVQPSIQRAAMNALLANQNANQDGAVVVLDPRNGAVLAMASNPSFDPNPLASSDVATEQQAGTGDFHTHDPEGAYPGFPLATFNDFFPGSTFKVVTSTAVYNLMPSLANFTWPANGGQAGCTAPGEILQAANPICNDAGTPQNANPCGGGLAQMLPQSCDPGYAVLGVHLGASTLSQQANLFGFNVKPPIDLNSNIVAASTFPTPAQLANNIPGLAFSAFGQFNVRATALQNAMVAAGIADNGTVMTPHLMAEVRNSQGGLVQLYQPKAYKQAATAAAAQQVNSLMQGVVNNGTASGIFDPSLEVAAKTGTAQDFFPIGSKQPVTDDWMIAFAPATNPVVAVAVVVPYQQVSASGAEVAGPIVNAVIQAAFAVEHPATPPPTTTTTTTAPNNAPQQTQPTDTTTTTSTTTAPPESTTTAPPETTTTTVPSTTTLPTTPPGNP